MWTDYQVLPPQETEDEYNLVIADDEQIVPGENGQLVILSTEYQIAQPKRYTAGRLLCGKSSRDPGADLAFRAWYNLLRWIFYAIKLKQPLSLLLQSADRISQATWIFVWTIQLRMKWRALQGYGYYARSPAKK